MRDEPGLRGAEGSLQLGDGDVLDSDDAAADGREEFFPHDLEATPHGADEPPRGFERPLGDS